MNFPDQKQNFWQLGSITGTALGIPAMVIGGQLAQEYGPGTALTSIIIGNIILWIIGLGIISMAQNRSHAIENIRSYLGKQTGLIAASIWIISFLIWYAIQIDGISTSFNELFHDQDGWLVGAILGVFVALISIGGIVLIKWVCVIGLPLLIIYAFFLIATSNSSIVFDYSWNLSFSAILTIILVWLPGTVNLPTFFRHSISRAHSVLGLTMATILHVFFQIFTILIKIDDPEKLLKNTTLGLTVIFVLFSYILSNLLNIYYASAGWETIISKNRSKKEYFIVGLLGTITYVISQTFTPADSTFNLMNFIESLIANFIASLGSVLLISFLIRTIVKHRPRPLEKITSSLCWYIGCISSTISYSHNYLISINALKTGVITSIICFLVVLFVEETIWSVRNLPTQQFKKD